LLGASLSTSIAQETLGESPLGAVESFEFKASELYRAEGIMTFDGFRVTGENWNVTADSAIARSDELDFESGQWRFEGNIRVQLDTATLQADSAAFDFSARRLVLVELSGDPVTFEDQASADHEAVTGSATTLRYDDVTGSFELLGTVTLTVGPYQTTGCDLVYYLGEEEFKTGSTRCDDPFVTTITQPESEQTPVE
jgi:lipopolysaccharide transport protein LptA